MVPLKIEYDSKFHHSFSAVIPMTTTKRTFRDSSFCWVHYTGYLMFILTVTLRSCTMVSHWSMRNMRHRTVKCLNQGHTSKKQQNQNKIWGKLSRNKFDKMKLTISDFSSSWFSWLWFSRAQRPCLMTVTGLNGAPYLHGK